MTQTITIRYRLYVDDTTPLVEVSEAYRDACNHISEYMFAKGMDDIPSFRELHDSLYLQLRTLYGLKAQMAQSAMRTVLAQYSALITQIRDSEMAAEAWNKRKAELEAKGRKPNTKRPKITAWTRVRFRALQCDQLANRDWSIKFPCIDGRGVISISTLIGRLEFPYTDKGYEQYRNCRRGTAKLVIRNDGKVFLHVSIDREVPDDMTENTRSSIRGVKPPKSVPITNPSDSPYRSAGRRPQDED